MTTLDLFNPAHAARATDPTTSHEAAAHVAPRVRGQRRTCLRLLAAYGPATCDRIDGVAGWRVTTAGRRVPELAALGLVEPTGETAETNCGTQAALYRITEAGREYV